VVVDRRRSLGESTRPCERAHTRAAAMNATRSQRSEPRPCQPDPKPHLRKTKRVLNASWQPSSKRNRTIGRKEQGSGGETRTHNLRTNSPIRHDPLTRRNAQKCALNRRFNYSSACIVLHWFSPSRVLSASWKSSRTYLRRIPASSCHSPILSGNGASNEPGSVQVECEILLCHRRARGNQAAPSCYFSCCFIQLIKPPASSTSTWRGESPCLTGNQIPWVSFSTSSSTPSLSRSCRPRSTSRSPCDTRS
jgi:hypothetical protein